MNINNEDMEITLSLLQTVAERPDITQRNLSKRLGLALGLTNGYLKYCVKEGLIKVEQIPANRYLYYLTSKGLAQKSRLMVAHVYRSMEAFRKARLECSQFFNYCLARGFTKVAVIGSNDLSELSCLVASSYNIDVTLIGSFSRNNHLFDCWIITDVKNAQDVYDSLSEEVDDSLIFCFSALKVVQKTERKWI